MEAVALLTHDIREILSGITMLEISRQGLFALWLLILFLPLKGVDRRDMLACLVYTMFLGAAAATLFYAIPKALVEEQASFREQLITLGMVFVFGIIRWNVDFKDLSKIVEDNLMAQKKADAQGGKTNGNTKKVPKA